MCQWYICVQCSFSLGAAQVNVIKRYFVATNEKRIIPSYTTIIKQRVLSPTACASLCSIHQECCSASFEGKSDQCSLDASCCPESEPSEDALMLKDSTESSPCPDGWVRYSNSCYFFSDEIKTWNDAKIACEEYGGMLAEVTSSSENDFLKRTSINFQWIGGTDSNNEDVWVWASSQTAIIFNDWAHLQPDGGTETENCLSFHRVFKWNDIFCSREYRFVCEKSKLIVANSIKHKSSH
ncbi:unnamed protein product [Mytilus edulis]|uniref:C-type lectin domain-containing protein n=1 Tax=Mytilus edulis TaxID=6550 RepID=A0A8S3PXQ4_MYTED|nr:unnamed protein product [Mytilus edulis]